VLTCYTSLYIALTLLTLTTAVLQAVEAFQALRAANTPESLNKHYRLFASACAAAVRAQNYEVASE
jgi:hypothetical protein